MERNDSDVTIRVFFTNMGWAVKGTRSHHMVLMVCHIHIRPWILVLRHSRMPAAQIWCLMSMWRFVQIESAERGLWSLSYIYIYLSGHFSILDPSILNIGYVQIYAGALSISRKKMFSLPTISNFQMRKTPSTSLVKIVCPTWRPKVLHHFLYQKSTKIWQMLWFWSHLLCW